MKLTMKVHGDKNMAAALDALPRKMLQQVLVPAAENALRPMVPQIQSSLRAQLAVGRTPQRKRTGNLMHSIGMQVKWRPRLMRVDAAVGARSARASKGGPNEQGYAGWLVEFGHRVSQSKLLRAYVKRKSVRVTDAATGRHKYRRLSAAEQAREAVEWLAAFDAETKAKRVLKQVKGYPFFGPVWKRNQATLPAKIEQQIRTKFAELKLP